MKRRLALLAALVVIAGAAGAAYYYFWLRPTPLPAGIAAANGRVEAERVDIATKYAGRLAAITVEEGDWVDAGEVVARLDTEELDAQIRQAEANVNQARQQLAEARANRAAKQTELTLAQRELERTQTLYERGHVSEDLLDQRTAARDNARAAVAAARAAIDTRQGGVDAAQAQLERLQAQRRDYTLKAPVAGRIQYRLAQPGEVLASGGRVLTLLNLQDVYMTIFLPTRQAGRVPLGGEARIILDAAEEYVIPARVSFVASDAQFTPKHVETDAQRARLMFRVKLRVPEDVLTEYADLVKTGLPGMGYVRLGRDTPWPEWLTTRLPEPAPEQ
ncbi:HlyD family efflux transporter periplasmic adaptor subunit [Arhodomonas aquaeolei]|uniref:HlyD family secretion protein n=1 Tax=Arhodomonas aquaeolei TaxID=2369 RepID=UPI002166EFDC|nr:HlyD family efflux transporter periplasmic adaptor subunit [Arhodomonas aquaeolei]MCS4502537.1 HlyD family efflux transporter periplasmic adaptor subunit [Arhodomonas aquaeolei]